MALETLGWVTVTTAGTPVQVSATTIRVHSVLIQQIAGQTGAMHVGRSTNMDPTDGTDMLASLSIPTTNALPSYSAHVDWTGQQAGIDLSQLWIDSGQDGESVLVSYLEV